VNVRLLSAQRVQMRGGITSPLYRGRGKDDDTVIECFCR